MLVFGEDLNLETFLSTVLALCHFIMPSLWDTGIVPGVDPQGIHGPVGKIDM